MTPLLVTRIEPDGGAIATSHKICGERADLGLGVKNGDRAAWPGRSCLGGDQEDGLQDGSSPGRGCPPVSHATDPGLEDG